MRLSKLCSILILGVLLLVTQAAVADDATIVYSFKILDRPGAEVTQPFGINNKREIVGRSCCPTTGFLNVGDLFVDVNIPGAGFTDPYKVNDVGKIGGSMGDEHGSHGFILDGGSVTLLDVPGGDYTGVYGLNDLGQAVGGFGDADGHHAFFFDGVTYSRIDIPGAANSTAFGINNSGVIVGSYVDSAGKTHGFIWRDGVSISIDGPGALNTWVYDINSLDDVVGEYTDTSGRAIGFVLSAGDFAVLDIAGSSEVRPMGINDSREVVGFFQDGTGTHGFLASPLGVLEVEIMIKPPASPPVSLSLNGKGKIPVAIVSTDNFNATAEVDTTSLTFGRTGTETSLASCDAVGHDVDGDGRLDLVCYFNARNTGIVAGDTVARLHGGTVSGREIRGAEAISTKR
jgi:probable HAF family extracellular repeat protein